MKSFNQNQSKKKCTQTTVRNGLIFSATLLLGATSQLIDARTVSNGWIESKTVSSGSAHQSTRTITFHAMKRSALVVNTARKSFDIKWAQLVQTRTRTGRALTTIQFKLWNGKSYIEVIGPVDAQNAVTQDEKRAVLVRAVKAAFGDSSGSASAYSKPVSMSSPRRHYVVPPMYSAPVQSPAMQQSLNSGSVDTTVVANNVAMTYSDNGKHEHHRLGLPNPSLAAPNAFGGRHTTVFASLGYVNHWNGGSDSDGNMGLGISFGDPRKYLGALVSVNNDTLGFRSESFGANGGFGVRLNRYVARDTALAMGATNLPGWGSFASASQNYYFAMTQGIRTALPITLNAGVGTGDFATQGTTATVLTDGSVGEFAGVGVEVYRNLSLITDWAREELNVGASYGFRVVEIPIFISAGAMNVTQAHGADYRWQLSAAVAYRLNA